MWGGGGGGGGVDLGMRLKHTKLSCFTGGEPFNITILYHYKFVLWFGSIHCDRYSLPPSPPLPSPPLPSPPLSSPPLPSPLHSRNAAYREMHKPNHLQLNCLKTSFYWNSSEFKFIYWSFPCTGIVSQKVFKLYMNCEFTFKLLLKLFYYRIYEYVIFQILFVTYWITPCAMFALPWFCYCFVLYRRLFC